MKLRLTGAVQLEVIAEYFREAGYELADADEVAEVTYDVTARERELAAEVEGFYDERLRAIAGCPYSRAGILAIVEEFRWWLLAAEKKVLAVDADNTLWRGILSEDGKAALQPYAEFQTALRRLAADGVVIVLLSKNDPGSIDLDFVTLAKVNWSPKPGNLIEACRELNLGPDSVVFLDDNAHERAQMSAHLPEVTVAPWDGVMRERQLARRLREYFFFNAGRTAEDRLRCENYRRRQREPQAEFANRADYLKSLQLHVLARAAEDCDLDRLAQMAGKTNQFNATTRRRSREEFAALLRDGETRVFVFSAGDRFGEMGIVCYLVIDLPSRTVTDFVMSCRAMGRTLEHFAYEWAAHRLGYRPALAFVPSAKNAPFAEFRRTVGDQPLVTYFTGSGHES